VPVAQNGFSPLHLAARLGYHEIASLLIEKGAEVDHTDKVRTLVAKMPFVFVCT
jgi:ankyrin repeat protein